MTRRQLIGGSDAAAAVNLSRWKSPYRLWQEMVGEREPDDTADNEYAHFGTVLEDVVAREFQRRSGMKVVRDRRELLGLDCMIGHIDRRIVGRREGLECKTASLRMAKEWGEEGTDEIPSEYLVQCMHYLALTSYDAWHVAVLIAGNCFRTYKVQRDEEAIKVLIEREREFMSFVRGRRPPPPTTIEDVNWLWPSERAKTAIRATPEVEETVEKLRELKRLSKANENAMIECELAIKSYMQDNASLIDTIASREIVTWTAQEAHRIDIERLRKERPEIAAEFEIVTPSRVLRLKAKRNA